MSTDVALPHLIVEVLPCNALFLSSPTQSIIVARDTGDVLYTMTHAQALQAPRCSSVHFLVASKQEDIADCLIALLGDDKELHVYKIGGLHSGKVIVEEIFTSPLPKRGVKMAWESTSGTERTLIIGDRHGDLRSFDINLYSTTDGEQVTKRRKVDGPAAGEEEDDDLDSTNPPHLGHVSMMTDYILTSFTSPSPQAPASFIITSDRDEHIRISRWGKRRAGHLALRYLLGSTGAIGGMCVIEHGQLSILQQAVQTDAAKDMCRQPLLLSTDSSRLRIWSLHKDEEASSRQDRLLVVDLYDIVQKYVKVDPIQERDRQRWHGKGKPDNKKKGKEDSAEAKTEAQVADAARAGETVPTVMHNLTATGVDGDVYISFLVDGSSGLFSFSLSQLMASSVQEAASLIQVLDLGLPVLSQAVELLDEGKGQPCLWLTCDVRQNTVEAKKQPGLRRVAWSREDRRWVESGEGIKLIERQNDLQSKGSSDLAHSLLLYDALTLYPKQEFELAASIQDAVAPNGLVRGGMTNFESLGQYKGGATANKMNNQRSAGKKVKAREFMLRRIEQTLEEAEHKDKPQE